MECFPTAAVEMIQIWSPLGCFNMELGNLTFDQRGSLSYLVRLLDLSPNNGDHCPPVESLGQELKIRAMCIQIIIQRKEIFHSYKLLEPLVGGTDTAVHSAEMY